MSGQGRRLTVCPIRRAGRFDHVLRRLVHDPGRLLRPHVEPGMTVLDFGCGPGFFLPKLAELVGPHGRVHAVDLQQGMLDLARRKITDAGLASQVVLQRCELHGFEPTAVLDFVLLFHVVHEVPEPRPLLTAIRGRLRSPASTILLVEPRGHVPRREFDRTVSAATGAGYHLSARPRMLLDRAVLFRRGPDSGEHARPGVGDRPC